MTSVVPSGLAVSPAQESSRGVENTNMPVGFVPGPIARPLSRVGGWVVGLGVVVAVVQGFVWPFLTLGIPAAIGVECAELSLVAGAVVLVRHWRRRRASDPRVPHQRTAAELWRARRTLWSEFWFRRGLLRRQEKQGRYQALPKAERERQRRQERDDLVAAAFDN